jgi:hypothetical protein
MNYLVSVQSNDFSMSALAKELAAKELEQIDKQIEGAKIRIAVAEMELKNHDRQIDNATAIEEYLRDKYTSTELYNWMTTQISALFFQTYQLAYDLAKRAEQAFRFERGLTNSSFIQFGYWDSLRKGLLSGERLYFDLKRLEAAYLDQSRRDYEITRQVSLVLHDPVALITLKMTGRCEVELPEALFDADYPGHYMRRLKSVSLTIPCVTGPYTNINCTLTLLSNKVRTDGSATDNYPESIEDTRFVTNFGAMQAIATSHANNDSGMFELNFRDERYLPFEGAGAISKWRIDLPTDCNAFDFSTITDVVIKLNYTAREGGDLLREKARAEVFPNAQAGLVRMFSAKHEFSQKWFQFFQPRAADDTKDDVQHVLHLPLTKERFPYQFRGRKITINSARLFLKLKEGFAYTKTQLLDFDFRKEGGLFSSAKFQKDGSLISNLPSAIGFEHLSEGLGEWRIEVKKKSISSFGNNLPPWLENERVNNVDNFRLKASAIEDIWLLLEYSVLEKL